METIWFYLTAGRHARGLCSPGRLSTWARELSIWAWRAPTRERRAVLDSIGSVWNGNTKSWLLASGGTLFFAFPALYASGFSGFYLPLMIVLWLLVLRGIAIEFRNHIASPVWTPLWDAWCSRDRACFWPFFTARRWATWCAASRWTPAGISSEPLWTNFRLGPANGILDWYTILVGLAAYFALAQHGTLWVAYKTTGTVRQRARHLARWDWPLVVLFTIVITWATFRVQPQVLVNFSARPWGLSCSPRWRLPGCWAFPGCFAGRTPTAVRSLRHAPIWWAC